jgi:hypothetical protein
MRTFIVMSLQECSSFASQVRSRVHQRSCYDPSGHSTKLHLEVVTQALATIIGHHSLSLLPCVDTFEKHFVKRSSQRIDSIIVGCMQRSDQSAFPDNSLMIAQMITIFHNINAYRSVYMEKQVDAIYTCCALLNYMSGQGG